MHIMSTVESINFYCRKKLKKLENSMVLAREVLQNCSTGVIRRYVAMKMDLKALIMKKGKSALVREVVKKIED